MTKAAPPRLVLLPPLPTAAVAVAATTAAAASAAAALTGTDHPAAWAAITAAAAAAAVLAALVWPRVATDVLRLHGASLPTPTDGGEWPLLGRVPQLLAATRRKALAHAYVAWQARVGWGVNYQLYLFGRRAVVLADPADIRAVTTRADAPRDRGLLWHFGTAISRDMLFIVAEPRHSTARRLVHPFLSGVPTTECVLRVVNETLWGVAPPAARATAGGGARGGGGGGGDGGDGGNVGAAAAAPPARWAAHLDALAATGEPVDVDDLMTTITVDVIYHLLFSHAHTDAELDAIKRRLLRMIHATTDLVGLPAATLLGARAVAELRAGGDHFVAEFERRAAARRAAYADGSAAAAAPRDMLDIMLADLDNPAGAYEGDRRRVAADMLFYVMAGYDTTAHSIAWTMHALLDNPDVEARLVAELDAALPPTGEPITAAHLAAMPYADAVWKESLRLFPPAPNGTVRKLAADLRLPSNGDVLPAGTVIHLPVLPAHRNPHAYPSPGAYDPARWLPAAAAGGGGGGGGGHAAAAQRAARAHYAPFSSGPRACPGQNMAAVEAKAVLAVLYRRYEWARVGDAAAVALENSVTMRPAGLRVTLCRRAAGA